MTLASCLELGGENCLSKRKTNTGAAEGKRGRSGGVRRAFLRSRGKRWCCNKSKSSECREDESDLRTSTGIQVSRWIKGRSIHLAKELGGNL